MSQLRHRLMMGHHQFWHELTIYVDVCLSSHIVQNRGSYRLGPICISLQMSLHPCRSISWWRFCLGWSISIIYDRGLREFFVGSGQARGLGLIIGVIYICLNFHFSKFWAALCLGFNHIDNWCLALSLRLNDLCLCLSILQINCSLALILLLFNLSLSLTNNIFTVISLYIFMIYQFHCLCLRISDNRGCLSLCFRFNNFSLSLGLTFLTSLFFPFRLRFLSSDHRFDLSLYFFIHHYLCIRLIFLTFLLNLLCLHFAIYYLFSKGLSKHVSSLHLVCLELGIIKRGEGLARAVLDGGTICLGKT